MEEVEIIVGTYENIIIGYKITRSEVLNKNYSLETSFTDDAHRGALRCLCVSSNGILASSSTDDSIRLHNLRRRKELGGLFQHSGTVNCITFYDKGHMFSASEDGTICMWKLRNWELLKTLKRHKSSVLAVAVHPSGKLGLSVGCDKSFITWDFVTGKPAFQRKLKDGVQNVMFTPKGDYYLLIHHKRLEVCSLADTKTVNEIQSGWRINAVYFLQDHTVAIGGDDRNVLILNILTGDVILTLDMAKPEEESYSSRVRSIHGIEEEDHHLVFLGAANGSIKAYKVLLSKDKPQADVVLYYETGLRLTCMALFKEKMPADKADGAEMGCAQEEAGLENFDMGTESERYDADPDEKHEEHVDKQEERGRPKKRKALQASKPDQKSSKLSECHSSPVLKGLKGTKKKRESVETE